MKSLLFALIVMAQLSAHALIESEPCEAALEKKATYQFLVKKLIKTSQTDELTESLKEINRTSRDYKALNSLCKR